MEKDEKIVEMYLNGISATIISKELEIGRRTVYRVIEKNNLPLQSSNKIKNKCLLCEKDCDKKICGTCNTNIRRYRVKTHAIEYLGSKCLNCGWVGDLSGFDFHHRNPLEKDFNPSAGNLANMSWESVKIELDKCDLLCALCHRKEHSNYDKLHELSLIYSGKTFI